MPKVLIGDIEELQVPFPTGLTPYPEQVAYMTKMLEALAIGEDALLESPTGTGKTLSLLSASIAFQNTFYRAVNYIKGLPDKIQALGNEQRDHELELFIVSVPLLRHYFYLHAWPIISRTQGAHVFKTPERNEAFHKVKMKIMESPVPHTATAEPPVIPKIIYASRTHGQLTQCVEVAQKLTQGKELLSLTLASKLHTCIIPKVREKAARGIPIDIACKIARRSGACKLHEDTKKENVIEQMRNYCASTPSLSTFISECERRGICPYYTTRALLPLITGCGLIVSPYNYVISSRGFGIGNHLGGSIVIFDEGHNIAKFVEDELSVSMYVRDLVLVDEAISMAPSVSELERLNSDPGLVVGDDPNKRYFQFSSTKEVNKLSAKQQKRNTQKADELAETRRILDYLRIAVEKVSANTDKSYDPRMLFQSMISISNVMETAITLLNTTNEYYSSQDRDRERVGALNRVIDFISMIHNTHVNNFIGSCVVCGVKLPSKDILDNTRIDFMCMTAAPVIQHLKQTSLVRSIIVTSGTLTPLNSIATELGLRFPIRYEGNHVIAPFQLKAAVVNSYKGVVMNSSYENRGNKSYMDMVGNMINDVCNVVNGGVIVFFPSTSVITALVNHWQTTNAGYIYRVMSTKRVLIVASADDKDDEVFKKLRKSSDSRTGSVSGTGTGLFKGERPPSNILLLAVCRGRFSEGIDFSDDIARCVLIVGIPYPPSRDPAVVLHQEYLDALNRKLSVSEQTISGKEWYGTQAARAVNQCIGRAIRHIDDYGVVLLVDERFAYPTQTSKLPKWVRSSLSVYKKGDDTYIQMIKNFFTTINSMMDNKRRGISNNPNVPHGIHVSVTTKFKSDEINPTISSQISKARNMSLAEPSAHLTREEKKKQMVQLLRNAKGVLKSEEYNILKKLIAEMATTPKESRTSDFMLSRSNLLLNTILPESEKHSVARKNILQGLCVFLPSELMNPIKYKIE